MGDKLDKAIAAKREEVAFLKDALARAGRAVEIAEAELTAFMVAAEYRPGGVFSPQPRKGRQPGAISEDWKEVLGVMHLFGRVSYANVLEIADASGLKTDLSNVRERVRTFIKNGLVEGDAQTGFMVTADAIRRFGFESEPPRNSPQEPPEAV